MKPITTIVGVLGRKETKEINKDISVTNFSIAVNELVKNENETGKWDRKTHWYNIEAWNSKSKVIEKHVAVGQLIAVKAIIENNLSSKDPKYQGQIKFIAEQITFEKPKEKEANSTSQANFTNDDIAF